MSLSKAAEALNKLLNSSVDTKKACSLPNLHSSSATNPKLNNSDEYGKVALFCKICSKNTRLQKEKVVWKYGKGKSRRKVFCQPSSTGEGCSYSNDVCQCSPSTSPKNSKASPVRPAPLVEDSAGLAVVSISKNSSQILPVIERILNVEDNSTLRISLLDTFDLEDFTPLDPGKYKTELCRSYQVHGYCKYGIRCNYAHGLTQLRVTFRHGKYKTRNCQSYHETGVCRYGARCSFIHDAEEGILKCPITDREVLEALHYRPMSELHHIATITWRMFDGNSQYPPTEVHFFTPTIPRSISEGSLDLDSGTSSLDSLLEETATTEQDNSVSSSENVVESSKSDQNSYVSDTKLFSVVRNESHKVDSTDTDETVVKHVPLYLFQDKEKLENLSKDTISFNSDKPKNLPPHFSNGSDRVESWKPPLNNNQSKTYKNRNEPKRNLIAGYDYYLKHKTRAGYDYSYKKGLGKTRENSPLCLSKYNACNSNDSSSFWLRNTEKTRSNSSQISSNFKLREFLKCLKTKEGKQHLASWIPDSEKKGSSTLLHSPPSGKKDSRDQTPKKPITRIGRDLSKYKTELCRSYQYNRYCEYKESCLYAHGTNDLRSYPKHPLYRTKQCFSFHKKGFCLYGSRCQFLHDAESPSLP